MCVSYAVVRVLWKKAKMKLTQTQFRLADCDQWTVYIKQNHNIPLDAIHMRPVHEKHFFKFIFCRLLLFEWQSYLSGSGGGSSRKVLLLLHVARILIYIYSIVRAHQKAVKRMLIFTCMSFLFTALNISIAWWWTWRYYILHVCLWVWVSVCSSLVR